MDSGLNALSRRVARLDERLGNPRLPDDLVSLLQHYLLVIPENFGTPATNGPRPYSSTADADAFVRRCRLLSAIETFAPEIVDGPARLDSQYWLATGKPIHAPPTNPTLAEEHFVGVLDTERVEVSTKPFRVGLFTSTGVAHSYGMWRIGLDMSRSSLWPLPWHTWLVEPHQNVRRCEVRTASDWVALVSAHPLYDQDLVFPDWRALAHSFDAVHMTLRAITAIQGIHLYTSRGVYAPTYWDVESTFWLRWCFRSVRLVEIAPRAGG